MKGVYTVGFGYAYIGDTHGGAIVATFSVGYGCIYMLRITSEGDKWHRFLLLNIKLNRVMFGIDPGARKRDPL